VEKEIESLTERLGLGHWSVVVSYEPQTTDDPDRIPSGRCTPLVDYDSARIVLNPEAFDGQDEVRKTLRHEMFHLVVSPYRVYRQAVVASQPDGSPLVAVLDEVWTHADERAVKNLERMYHGLTKPKPKPKKKKRGRNRA
jgi:hypothetical protein